MAKLICPECKKESLIKKKGDYETVYVDRHGKSNPLLVPNTTWLECEVCSERIIEDAAMVSIENERLKALRLLSPVDLRDFRTRLGKTQKAMSDLLGIGKKTYCRWESGSYVQSEAFDRYLRLLMAAESNVSLLQDIVNEKLHPANKDAVDEFRRTFSSIKDIRIAVGRSRDFVSLFSRGELQTVS